MRINKTIAMAALAFWLGYWGSVILSAHSERRIAEAAWFAADARRDWRAAERFRSEVQRASKVMANAGAAGLLPPLALLIVMEVETVIARRRMDGDIGPGR